MASSLRPKKNPFYTTHSTEMKSSKRPKAVTQKAKDANQKAFEDDIDRQLGNAAKGYKKGGAVRSRGCGGMVSGKKYSGTY